MSFFGSGGQGGTEQASFWKNFQDFFTKVNLKDQGAQPAPSQTPASQQPQTANFMQQSNQQMPNFLSQMQQLAPTPMPQQQPTAALRGRGGQLPPDSYASQIRGFTQSYK